MDKIMDMLKSANIDPATFGMATLVLVVGTLLLGSIGRFAFGKKSTFSHAVSSSIGILFVYAAAIVVYSVFSEYKQYIPPLPFATFNGSDLVLFTFTNAHYTVICSQVLDMIILAFIANLLDSWIPRGKHLFTWLLSKCATIVGAAAAQILVNWLLNKYLPQGLMTYAPTILLGLLILLVLVGALKLIVGAILSTVHPVIGAFYTFFFSTLVGKAITRALLTAAILSGIVYALEYIGCTVISIASAALIAYIPLLIVLALIWYLVNKIL